MKGVMFTLDALFSLVVAGVGVSILLYFNYYAQNPSTIPYSNAQAIMYNLAATPVEAIQNGSILAKSIANQFLGANETWPQSMGWVSGNSSNPVGPIEPIISSIFTATNAITTGVVADYGNIYFAAGSTVYAVNATANKVVWSSYTLSNVASTPAIYLGSLIFANAANIIALDARTGAAIWSVSLPAAATSPVLAYDGKVLLGASNGWVYSFYTNNGILAWSNYTGSSSAVLNITVASGSFLVRTSANKIMLISQVGSTAEQLWNSIPISAPTTALVSRGSTIYFGGSGAVEAINIDGSLVSGFPIAMPPVSGVAVYNNNIAYQSSSSEALFYPPNQLVWSVVAPSYFGASISSATPVISGKMVYTLWSNGLAGQYLSNGTVAWFVNVPATVPYMALAYGRLYLVSGSQVIAYGSCNAPLHASLLSAVASLQLNGQSGCATALSYAAYPPANYSVSVGNSIANSFRVANLNGASSYVSVGSNSLPAGSQARSFFIWAYWTGTYWSGGNWAYLESSGTNSPNQLSNLEIASYIYFQAYNNDAACGSLIVSPNAWHFIGYTYSAGSTQITCYLDGASQTVSLGAGQPLNTGSSFFQLGAYLAPSGNGYFQGSLANAQLYNTALNATQVQQLYREGIPGQPLVGSGAIAWYPLGGDTNDYVGFNSGYASGVAFTSQNIISPSFSNAYSISKATTLLPLLNYSRWTQGMVGTYGIYPVGVYSWR